MLVCVGVRVRVLLGLGLLLEPLTLNGTRAQELAASRDRLALLGVLLGLGLIARLRGRPVAGILGGVADQTARVRGVLVGIGVRVRILLGLGILVEPLTLSMTRAQELAAIDDRLRL